MTANIYNTHITVYRGVDYNPDGTPVPWSFCTAWFSDDEDDGWYGEYLFCVDENDNIYPIGTVESKDGAETTEYTNYCEMLIAEKSIV